MPAVKEAVLIEARIGDLHALAATQMGAGIAWWVVTLQLPFPSDAGAVPSLLQVMTKRLHFRIERAEVEPIPIVVLAGHQLHARVRAQRLSIRVAKLDAFGGQAIEYRRLVARAAITSNSLHTDVISHDEDDIWAFFCQGRDKNASQGQENKEWGGETAPLH